MDDICFIGEIMKVRKARKDKLITILRTNEYCTVRVIYLFKGRREAKKFLRDELNNSGNYFIGSMTLGELRNLNNRDVNNQLWEFE